jgi:hypothetical protein
MQTIYANIGLTSGFQGLARYPQLIGKLQPLVSGETGPLDSDSIK